MTETTCLTCGAKCIRIPCIFKDCCKPNHVKALPQPDLSKLREIWDRYKWANVMYNKEANWLYKE